MEIANQNADAVQATHVNQYQLSKRWNISQRTLEYWRWERVGPTYVKMGRRVLYAIADVEEFERRNRQEISPKAIPYYHQKKIADRMHMQAIKVAHAGGAAVASRAAVHGHRTEIKF